MRDAPKRFSLRQRLTDADELADMGEQTSDHLDLIGPPAVRFEGVHDDPGDA